MLSRLIKFGLVLACGTAVACGTDAVEPQVPGGKAEGTADAGEFTMGVKQVGQPRMHYPAGPAASDGYPPGATFTQGLVCLADDTCWESVGMRFLLDPVPPSQLRRFNLETGASLEQVELPDDFFPQGSGVTGFFGEGLTRRGDKLYQLSYHEGAVLEWTLSSDGSLANQTPRLFEQKRSPGWGVCYSDALAKFVMSDGTAELFLLELIEGSDKPHFIGQMKRVNGTDRATVRTPDGLTLGGINALECDGEHVYANLWQTDVVAKIKLANDSAAGWSARVVGWADISFLNPAQQQLKYYDVPNGISKLADGSFMLTGKLHPDVYRVAFEQRYK